MKFCYVDESASANGSVVISVGVVVDAQRMHLSKDDWSGLLRSVGARLPTPLDEFKASDLYRGAGRWSSMKGTQRADVISDVVTWVAARKHTIVYGGVLKSAYDSCVRAEVRTIPDTWCAANQHVILTLQRSHQRIRNAKGKTVVIFDRGSHDDHLVSFVRSPASWTDRYYDRRPSDPPLEQVIDVPYFVDSKHALLVQVADLGAYILRRHAELSDLGLTQRYVGEASRIRDWSEALASRAPVPHIWPTQRRTEAHELFRELAPPSILSLGA